MEQNSSFDILDSLRLRLNILGHIGFEQEYWLRDILIDLFTQILPTKSRSIVHVKITNITTGRGLTVEFADGVGETAVQFCSPRLL